MKLYFTPKTLKKIIKLLLLFIFACIIIYAKNGMINVSALTTSNIDKELSNINVSFSKRGSMGISNGSSNLNQPLIFSSASTEFNQLYSFDTYIYFSNLETIEEYRLSGSNVHFYITYHFKYYYNLFNTDYFNPIIDFYIFSYPFSESNIYEEKIYTSIDSNGKVSYDQFVTFDFPFESINSINSNWSNSYFHPYLRVDYKEIPNLNSSVEVINAMFTSENAIPMSIEEYISNSDIDYYEPEFLPYEEEKEDKDGFIADLIEDIITKFKVSFITTWVKIKTLFINLFVPSDDFFKNAWEANFKFLEDKLGFLFLPISILEEVLKHFLNLGNGSGVIHIPTIKDPIYSQTLISAQDFNLKQIFSTGAIGTAHDVYLIVIDILIVVGLINLSWKKFNLIFKGGQE